MRAFSTHLGRQPNAPRSPRRRDHLRHPRRIALERSERFCECARAPFHEGRVFDACYNLFADPTQPVAVRVFSMTVAAKIAKNEPDLLEELRTVAVKYPQASTAGFRSRARRVLGLG